MAAVRADGYVGAFAGEFFRNGAAESFAGRRNDRNAAREPQIHFLPLLQNFHRLAK
jgi:hypothetical protein